MKSKDLLAVILKEELQKEEEANYMFFQNLKSIRDFADEMLAMDPMAVDQILTQGHSWAVDHIATSKDDIEEVKNFLKAQ